MKTHITIDFLKNHPNFVPVVGEWMFNEWGNEIPGDSLAAARERVAGRLNDDSLPLTLIALREGKAVGTASIFQHDMENRPELSPWLAAVYVKENMRNLRIGSKLVGSVEKTAKKLGIQKFYLFTPDKRSFYERQGWLYFEESLHRGKQITILTKSL